MIKYTVRITIVVLLFFTFPACSQGYWENLPKQRGSVNDFENLFTEDEEKALNSVIEANNKIADVQIVIVTLDEKSTSEDKFEDLTLHIANSWGVGESNKDNGILIAISGAYRQIRIQNGIEIEKRLTDAETKLIIDEYIIPSFKKGKMYLGISAGLTQIWNVLTNNSSISCSIPGNGKYKMIHDGSNTAPELLIIQDSKMLFREEGILKEYEIIRHGNCRYTLEPKEKVDESKLTKLQKMMMHRKPFVVIDKTEEDTYYFTVWVDLHTTSGSGRIVKIDE